MIFLSIELFKSPLRIFYAHHIESIFERDSLSLLDFSRQCNPPSLDTAQVQLHTEAAKRPPLFRYASLSSGTSRFGKNKDDHTVDRQHDGVSKDAKARTAEPRIGRIRRGIDDVNHRLAAKTGGEGAPQMQSVTCTPG